MVAVVCQWDQSLTKWSFPLLFRWQDLHIVVKQFSQFKDQLWVSFITNLGIRLVNWSNVTCPVNTSLVTSWQSYSQTMVSVSNFIDHSKNPQLSATTITIRCSHWQCSRCYSSNLLGIVSEGSQQSKSAIGLEGPGSAASHWQSNVPDETWGVEV